MTRHIETGNKSDGNAYPQTLHEVSLVFSQMPVGVLAILDQKTKRTVINDIARDIFDLDDVPVGGAAMLGVIEERFPCIKKLIAETIENNGPIKNFTIEIEKRSAEIRTYLVSTALIDDRGEADPRDAGIVLVLHDISEITRLKRAAISNQRFGEMVGASTSMRAVYELIQTVAQYDTNVLIFGETGTGKELVARTIHFQSNRAGKPFVPVNCSALTPTLLESELFGHVKGAFTGAGKERRGRFEVAEGGTIFLDEIGTLSMDLQVKLLRILQERVIERVGSSQPIPINVRVISATNLSLTEVVAKKQFREDLYYRLKVFQIDMPPLRNRRADIPLLAGHFIARFNRLYGKNILGLSDAAREKLIHYYWPGNVRELGNAIEHAMILTNGKIIEPVCLPPEIRHAGMNGSPPPPPQELYSGMEEETIRRAMAAYAGNVSKAAKSLNMHRSTLWRKMRCYNIQRSEFERE